MLISGFDSERIDETPFAVNFATAKRLKAGGSTCDVYESTIQHRRVFIKRLKAEYRDNPLYRSAFYKEYNLGVSFSHPSLPRYVGFGDDYIVMDFIEGDTLADLIKRNDPRIKNKQFAKKLLRELFDAVNYLHNRNIIHCDIKPDNIIISPYPDHPATLIDFDKAYSSWFDSSHGNTEKYDCDRCDDGLIDFKGIGKIAEKLGLKRVAETCKKENVSAESIKKTLATQKYRPLIFIAIIGIAVILSLLIWNHREDVADSSKKGEMAEAVNPVKETDSVDSIVNVLPAISASVEKISEKEPPQATAPAKPGIDQAWIRATIEERTREIEGYKKQLWAILYNDTISILDKNRAVTDFISKSGHAENQIIFSAVEKYSYLSELDVQMAVRKDPAFIRLEKDLYELYPYLITQKWMSK